MFLKQEIEKLLKAKNIRKSKYYERDSHIILEYFGFGENKFPTQELLGNQYGITREYVSKDIIQTKFKNKVQIEELPALTEISETLEKAVDEHGYIFYSDLLQLLKEKDLIDDSVHLKGLLNLLESFHLVKELNIYTTAMGDATKVDIRNEDEFLVVKNEIQKNLRKNAQKLLKLPGRIIGICCLDDVYEKDKNLPLTFTSAKKLLQNTNAVWSKEIDDKFWYLVEDRGNPIYTVLGKIKSVGISFQKNILVKVVENALRAHTLPRDEMKLIRPNEIVIGHYLDSSRYTTPTDKDYVLRENLEFSDLSDSELDLIEYFRDRSTDTYQNIISYLQQKNHRRAKKRGNDILKKNCFNSPFLYKSPVATPTKRGEKFNFYFITNYIGNDSNNAQNDYQVFRSKLLDLYGRTDIDRELKTRSEQPILRNWLFRNKKVEKCAICGKEYSVNSLVVAHKKPRAKCSDNERTDPYIVMPACKFGCDYVYEKRWIKIANGIVEENEEKTLDLLTNERLFIESIKGRKLDDLWTQGEASYFSFVE